MRLLDVRGGSRTLLALRRADRVLRRSLGTGGIRGRSQGTCVRVSVHAADHRGDRRAARGGTRVRVRRGRRGGRADQGADRRARDDRAGSVPFQDGDDLVRGVVNQRVRPVPVLLDIRHRDLRERRHSIRDTGHTQLRPNEVDVKFGPDGTADRRDDRQAQTRPCSSERRCSDLEIEPIPDVDGDGSAQVRLRASCRYTSTSIVPLTPMSRASRAVAPLRTQPSSMPYRRSRRRSYADFAAVAVAGFMVRLATAPGESAGQGATEGRRACVPTILAHRTDDLIGSWSRLRVTAFP